jgi:putative flippase GtrA
VNIPFQRLSGLFRAARSTRIVRFIAVGTVNTAFGYGLFACLFLATGAHLFAVVMATVGGILFNYQTTGRLVFGNRGMRALLPFVTGYAITMLLNLAILELLVRCGANPLLAQAICLPVVVVSAYAINANVVFRQPEQDKG